MERGEPYRAGDPELTAARDRAADLLACYNATARADRALREELLHELLGSVGDDVTISPPFTCDYGSYISLGQHTFVNYDCVFLDVASITVGEACQFGPKVQLLTPTHPIDPEDRRGGWEAGEPITIGDNVWLGGGAIVCPGVTIGADTVIGAGSVVAKDIPAGVVAVGNPARVIREV
jgi:maltose O-acetyltransferase